jgi:predicted helicase
VDEILKEDFAMPNGIADNTKIEHKIKDTDKERVRDVHKVQILDPATGTGTFLAEIVRHVHANIVSRGLRGTWNQYVAEDLLPRLHGFEILMAPYAMAHLKLDMFLEGTGFEFKNAQRVGVYLTNSLEKDVTITERFGFITWLTDEAEGANKVKKETPVMVVVGNPPYNVSTMNKSKFAESLIARYKEGEGVEKERNIQPLSDDYIKFIALGQHFIESNSTQCGILAYISNNSFLDGLIHRQMRKSLLETFDKIYIINLHGNSKKKETALDGGKDDNVFNIQVGTSINIFVKLPAPRTSDKPAKVYYADLFGKRQDKYDFLSSKKLKRTGYTPLKPAAPFYFFVPKDFSLQQKYEKGFSIVDLFPTYSSGVQTKRDTLFIDNDKEILIDRMKTLLSGDYDWRFEDDYRVEDTNGYEIKRLLKGKKFNRQFVQPIEYRPFDRKWIYYDPDLLARPFYSTMRHMLGSDNVALLTCRQQSTFPFQHVFVSSVIADRCSVSSQTKELTYVFPLYVRPDNFGLIAKRGFDEPNAAPAFVSKHIIDRRVWTRPGMQGAEQIFPLYVNSQKEEWRPNFNPEIVAKIAQIIGKKVKPEKLFDYIYGILHSPKYRKDYEEFVKIDFPRIPYPTDNTDFERFAKFGQRLRELHLLEKVPKIKTTFTVADGNMVESVRYVDGKVYINTTQYFGNVPASAWTFYIGGYQPLQKYLKDRKGRQLSFEEIEHYQKIVAVLNETIEIMDELER